MYISLPSLHDFDVKMPSFTYYGGRKQDDEIFFFSDLAVRNFHPMFGIVSELK